MADITMPQLGETVTEGTITKWSKQVGDAVAEDEVLFEVSTDKVDSEVPSPVSGTLTQIIAQEGDTVPVGAVIAVVEAGAAAPAATPTETVIPAEAGIQEPSPAPTPPPAPDLVEPAPAPEPSPPVIPAQAGIQEPVPVQAQPAAQSQTQQAPIPSDLVLSPVVRRMISDNNIDVSQIAGTGAGGRITRRDVEALVGSGNGNGNGNGSSTVIPDLIRDPVPTPQPQTQPAAQAQQSAQQPVIERSAPYASNIPGKGDVTIPFSNVRKRTADHMLRSKATSAHTLVVVDVDFMNVDIVRKANKAKVKAEDGVNLTYLPFIARAVCDALREFPNLNASVGNEELIIHNDINMGFAVDMNFEGLIVPVAKQADTKRLRALAREVADLADRARNKKLGADEISGGTFTITNAGGYGTVVTYPVINQPQIAILSTDGVKKRPVVVTLPDGSDGIAIHPVGNLALAWDHRAVDGAYAAAFVAKVRDILETRNWAEEL